MQSNPPDDAGPGAAGVPAPAQPLPALLNREEAILHFNRRVLAQATRADVPLLERLRYLIIVSANLDEFFEIRFSPYLERFQAQPGTAALAALQGVADMAREMVAEQYALLNDVLMPELRRRGIVMLNHAERDDAQRRWVARYFHEQVRPLLVPVALDPAHPFPQVASKSLNFILRLKGQDAFGRESDIAILKVPRALPRVIRLPDAVAPGQQAFVLLTSVIRAHLAELFEGREVVAFSQFRVTRHADLLVDDDDVTNLREALRQGLATRQFGRAVRLEVVNTCPADLSSHLLSQFELPQAVLYQANGPVNLVRLSQWVDAVQADDLRFAPLLPAWPVKDWPAGESIFERLSQGDMLLHHPFQSFEPVVRFLREAVHDPAVVAIKQTIYRTGSDSELMHLLIEAARRGKEVTCVVELKARFDEEANIDWAERLESVGAQVVYGIVGLKTHAKLLLVTRREGRGLKRFVHLSTGNYNPKTARLYTDVGYFSADAGLTAEAEGVFQQLASQEPLKDARHLVSAPFRLRRRMLKHLGQVQGAARAGGPARVVVKCNALTDPVLIRALVQAAAAGAGIDLIVRGACLLAPCAFASGGRVAVRSVVGRFLEHSRVFYFRWGEGGADEALYLSSADWMGRNMMGRIELAWPVREPLLRQRVIDECLQPYLHDRVDAWDMQADGSYQRARGRGASAQQALRRLLAAPAA